MPNETIDQHQVIQFSDKVHMAAQQMDSRMKPLVTIEKMTGDVFAYDGMGQIELRKITDRYAQIVFDSVTHTRRRINRERFAAVIPIDQQDVRGMLSDPTGRYAKIVVAAMQRRFDRTCIEAIPADIATGRNFETTVTALADGVQTVVATGGIDYIDLLDIKKNFVDKEVNKYVTLLMSGDEQKSLLQQLQLTSGDYSHQYSLEKGEITAAVGMSIVTFGGTVQEPLLPVVAGIRECYAIAEGSIHVGMSKEMSIKVQERNDLHETSQLVIEGEFGAVRTEGVLAQIVQTTD